MEYTKGMTDNHFICSVLRILQINNVFRKVHVITLETEVTSKVLNEVLNSILCLLVVSSRWFFICGLLASTAHVIYQHTSNNVLGRYFI